MAVAKRQGREKPAKTEQRKVKGRSRTRVRTSGRTALLTKPNLHGAGPGGRKKHIKRGAKGLSLFLPHAAGALFSSRLWIYVPSRLEDGFSCFLLNKIELICLRAITRSVRDLRAITKSVQDPRAVPLRGGFNVRHSKSLLWRDKNQGAYTRVT